MYTIIFGETVFFSIIKHVFGERREFYLYYYDHIFKDCVLFRWTCSSIEIDVIVVKKHVFLNFLEKYVRLSYYNCHFWICLNIPEYAYTKGILNLLGVLNMQKFWISQSFEYSRVFNVRALHIVLNIPEYALTEFWIHLGF